MRGTRIAAWLLFCACSAAAAAPSDAEEALAAIARRESAISPLRLVVRVTDRQLKLSRAATLDELREPLEKATPRKLKGELDFTRVAWLRTLSPVEQPSPLRSRTAWSGGVLRSLAEGEQEGMPRREGRLVTAPQDAPGDAVLTRRVAPAAGGIAWRSAERREGRLRLEGERLKEKHWLELGQADHRVLNWEIDRDVETPEGGRFRQQYRCEVKKHDGEGNPLLVREWIVNPPPIGLASLRETEVVGESRLPQPASVHVTLRFPKGTEVIDSRTAVTLEYTATGDLVDEPAAAEAARAVEERRVEIGKPAPPLAGAPVSGELPPPAELKGKPVFLFWFSPGSRFSEEWAPIITEMAEDYGPLGVQFVALGLTDVAGEEALRKFGVESGWKFPVLRDPDAAMLRRLVATPGLPSVAVIDREGALAHASAGVDLNALVPLLDKLTGRKPGEPEPKK